MMTVRSILIVDDEANQRLIIEHALHTFALDWMISTAASAQEALDSLASHSHDLIITDYDMPAMNGLELITELRERHIPSPVILITAHSSSELYDAVRRLHIDYYLTKPVPLTMLRSIAADALGAA